MPSFPTKLSFVSFLKYSPYRTKPSSVRSQHVRHALKNDGLLFNTDLRAIDHAAAQIYANLESYPELEAVFGRGKTLVPVPRRSPLVAGALWPTLRICQSLDDGGLARDVIPLLVRHTTPESHTRLSPEEHYATIRAERLLVPPTEITLVDDSITRGSTLVACVTRLQETFPNVPIRCFSLVRTMTNEEIDNFMTDPVEGTIEFSPPNWFERKP